MRRLILFVLLAAPAAHAQFQIQSSNTTADLRGIDNVGNGVAWASGTDGAVLRTEDGGYVWQTCAIPPGAEKLDFRGIQAFDANTAIVMSSGKGDLSRLYKTTDGCHTWKLVFTNPDEDGFWDGLQFDLGTGRKNGRVGHLIGDPVDGKFADFTTYDYGGKWSKDTSRHPEVASARSGESIFAASNSSMILIRDGELFVTGGSTSRARTLELHVKNDPYISFRYVGGEIPVKHGPSAGAFSVAAHLGPNSIADADSARFVERATHYGDVLVVVGGDYGLPENPAGTGAFSDDGGLHWLPAQTPPHGYRSAVAYDPQLKLWITVGPNGTDISTDDGRNWRPVHPSAALHESPDADRNWNALSLPFVVGPKGRIGKLDSATLGVSPAQ